ncbi:MAG: heme lyase CcmF/NrfE family subunit [Steroidobacteraceae bacterium]
MLAELGSLALVLALLLALVQSVTAFASLSNPRPEWALITRNALVGQCLLVFAAFACLIALLVRLDFSVLYVAQNANSALPVFYRVAAAWGAHEGSLLLWIVVLSIWSLAVLATSRQTPNHLTQPVYGVLGAVSVGFLAFTALTSNPFARLWPAAADGNDLNPLLQDVALAAHPPMLYMGYVGFSVTFAFAFAGMVVGRIDPDWARTTRRWANLAWIFLTVGITLGSWWAYYELGWGGWWFWDAVENASFMPWLVGTALIHSLIVTEKRGLFQSWTLLLSIIAFSLCLLGTFLVRSGVIVSVHSFAADPGRGVFILALLLFYIGGALVMYSLRAKSLRSTAGFALWSRESFLLFNNMLLLAATGVVFVGTLAPLFADALGRQALSVGPPYFNATFLVPMLPMLLLLSVGMHAAWKRPHFLRPVRRILLVAAIVLVLALTSQWFMYSHLDWRATLLLVAGLPVAVSALAEIVLRLRERQTFTREHLGMCVAHLGVGGFAVAIAVVAAFSTESDTRLGVGDSVTVAGYQFTFKALRNNDGPNYQAVQADVVIARNGKAVATLTPEKRVYRVQQNPMTEAGILPGITRDLFVALGEPLGENAWSFRIQYKPALRYVWLSALLMALGALLSLSGRRLRQAAVAAAASVALVGNAAAADGIESARVAIQTKQFAAAVKQLETPARAGEADAQYLLGVAALNGLGMPEDDALAKEWLRKASEQRHGAAAFALAGMLSQEDGASVEEIWRLVQVAADAKYQPAIDALKDKRLPMAAVWPGRDAARELRFGVARLAAADDDSGRLDAVGAAEFATTQDGFGRGLLHAAAMAGAERSTRWLLEKQFPIDAADQFGTTPLMLAAEADKPAALGVLLAAGAKPQLRDSAGRDALAYATWANRTGSLTLLLDAGAKINATDKRDWTALDIAIQRSRDEAAELLRARGGVAKQGSRSNALATNLDTARLGRLYQGWEPLQLAASRGDVALMRQSLAQGGKVNAATPQGDRAIHLAARAGSVEAVDLLLKSGADAAATNASGQSLLTQVAASGNVDLVQLLLRAGVSTGKDEPVLLVQAASRGDAAMVRTALAAGADVESRHDSCGTALLCATRSGDADTVRALLEKGANPNANDKDRRAALWYAASAGRADLVAQLLAARASVDAIDRNGSTALMAAAGNGDGKVVAALLAAGANVNASNDRGNTPLIAAAEAADVAVIKSLLAARARIDAQNTHGDTALMIAVRRGHVAAAKLLVEGGASRSIRNKDRATVVDVAKERGLSQLLAVLGS